MDDLSPLLTTTRRSPVHSAERFERGLAPRDRARLGRVRTPAQIQTFLDSIPYSAEPRYRSPLTAIRDRRAHCFDGAVLGAALLERIGHPPLVLNMFPNERDDEHVIAPFRRHGAWGAVAQSNMVGLRYREPIHRTLRELMISYFEQYFNVVSEKTLRSYTRPISLAQFDRYEWMTDDRTMERIADRLEELRRTPLLTRQMVAGLAGVDRLAFRAGMLGSVKKGLYQV
jgi:hypothetical protein